MKLVVFGLSITSSWGNGHATTYRALLREFAARGHDVLFLERDVPWYASHRDLAQPDFCRVALYNDIEEMKRRHESEVRSADAVIVGSYVPQGIEVGEWVVKTARRSAFYDIDTPVTLAKLKRDDCDYLSKDLIARYDAYFSFSGGPTLQRLEREFGSPRALPLYCSVDAREYSPSPQTAPHLDLGYLGTYSDDRQPTLETLLIEPARAWKEGKFCVAGPQYPADINWPQNVARIEHLPPSQHRDFYNAQRFTLNVTRADMIRAGWSPSVRLFEAAACATPILSDFWEGLDDFFAIGTEICVAKSSNEALAIVRDMPDSERRQIGEKARARVLARDRKLMVYTCGVARGMIAPASRKRR